MRKFEKVSEEQFLKDLDTLNYSYYRDKVILPKRGTSKSAGYDIYTPISFNLLQGEQILVPTGFKIAMEDDDVFLIFIRSSIGIKDKVTISNGTGVIDADYYNNDGNEGHVWLALKNNSEDIVPFSAGDRIAQGIFIKYNIVDNDEPIKETRNGGIGSTT